MVKTECNENYLIYLVNMLTYKIKIIATYDNKCKECFTFMER